LHLKQHPTSLSHAKISFCIFLSSTIQFMFNIFVDRIATLTIERYEKVCKRNQEISSMNYVKINISNKASFSSRICNNGFYITYVCFKL